MSHGTRRMALALASLLAMAGLSLVAGPIALWLFGLGGIALAVWSAQSEQRRTGELNQAKTALLSLEAELNALFQQTPVPLWWFDAQFNVLRTNRAATDLFSLADVAGGRSGPRDFIACDCRKEAKAVCARAGNAPKCEICRALSDTLVTGNSWKRVRIHTRVLRAGKSEEAVLLITTERVQTTGASSVILCVEDITHTAHADQQLHSRAAQVDVAGDAIFVRDFSDRILYWNDGAQRLYGWTSAEVRGKTSRQLIFAPGANEPPEALAALRSRDEWIGEMRHRARDGAGS